MRLLIRLTGFFCIVFLGIIACEHPEEKLDLQYTGGLVFTTDTVRFDTLFSGYKSTTYRFRAINKHGRAVKINSIAVKGESAEEYSITVNGEPGEIQNLVLDAQDSILLLVEANFKFSNVNTPVLRTDSIVFTTNDVTQDVKLLSWSQDVHYIGSQVVECGSVWQNDKPYVLYDTVVVDEGCQLSIAPGTRIFFYNGAGLFVLGSLSIQGIATDRVEVTSTRRDGVYKNLAGQWNGIYFLEGSKDNLIDFTTIRNGTVGIRVGTPDTDSIADILISNTIVENMSQTGIELVAADAVIENTLVNNCAVHGVAVWAGGNYAINHCTVVSYGFDFLREYPSFVMANFIPGLGDEYIMPLNATVANSIFYGNLKDEFYLLREDQEPFNILLMTNLLKTENADLEVNGNILNVAPHFVDSTAYNYRLDTLSPAKDAGTLTTLIFDLDSIQRDQKPDLGAYERIE